MTDYIVLPNIIRRENPFKPLRKMFFEKRKIVTFAW